MKKTTIIFVTLLALLLTTSQAYSGDRLLVGTLIGAGSGALIGQAIGGDTESTLLGTAIGGVAGLTAASITYNHRGYSSTSYGTSYRRPARMHGHYKQYQVPRHYWKKGRHHVRSYYTPRPVRHHFRDGNDCRIVIKQVFKRGHSYTVKKRICRNNTTFGQLRHDRQIRQYDRHDGRGKSRQYRRDF